MGSAGGLSFGDLLRRYRLAAGLTQEELAERAGLSARGISDLERGLSARARKETLNLLAAAMELTPEERAQLAQAGRARSELRPRESEEIGEPPSPATVPLPRHNLPLQLTSFVGRERELADLRHHLLSSRLLTVVGTGGAGKTRLALEAATPLVDDYPDGVWLIELAPLSDPALVPQYVATVLNVQEVPGRSVVASLVEHLRARHLLLILDNCEHLATACATLVQSLLRVCPRVSILATSREPLGVSGEVAWSIPPLAVPASPRSASGAGAPIRDLLGYEAVRLFVDRASLVASEFSVTPQNAAPVVQICRRLDGLPLALELAAARVKVLSVAQIAERLDRSVELLSAGGRAAPTRQRTLWATIDWSYSLLDEPERALFRRLSAFAGGFTLEAAEAIGEGVEFGGSGDVLACLAQLVDKSLVVVDRVAEPTRYHLLDTIRQYASAKLEETGEAAATHRQHARHYLAQAEAVDPWLWSPSGRGPWLGRLEADHDNLRAAIGWSRTEGGEIEVGLRLVGALWWFWMLRDHASEGRTVSLALLAQPAASGSSLARARALTGAGALAWFQNDLMAAKATFQEALAIWRGLGDASGLGTTLTLLSRALQDLGGAPDTLELATESVDHFRKTGDRWGLAWALNNLGYVSIDSVNAASARSYLFESLERFRQLGDPWGRALALTNLGYLAYRLGDFAQARRDLEEALPIFQAGNDLWSHAKVLTLLGNVARSEGDDARAEQLHLESSERSRQRNDQTGVAVSRLNLARIARDTGDLPRAGALYVQSLSYFHDQGEQWGVAECLIGVAGIAALRGQAITAARLFAAGCAMQNDSPRPWWAASPVEIERTASLTRRALGLDEAAFAEQTVDRFALEQAVEAAYGIGRSLLAPGADEMPSEKTEGDRDGASGDCPAGSRRSPDYDDHR